MCSIDCGDSGTPLMKTKPERCSSLSVAPKVAGSWRKSSYSAQCTRGVMLAASQVSTVAFVFVASLAARLARCPLDSVVEWSGGHSGWSLRHLMFSEPLRSW